MVSQLTLGGRVVDRYETPLGIRTFRFDVEKGFFLNGKPVKIRGVCNHHDLGSLGAAVNRRAIERQLEILKAMGVNGIRTSHNPPAPELLELTDKMGFIVMDEAFDVWKIQKTDEVELFLNGRSHGTKRKQGDNMHVFWRLEFEPGMLQALSRKNGQIVLASTVQTAEAPARIVLLPDRRVIKADGSDLSFITVRVEDKKWNTRARG